jgi:hypothetical protein
MEKIKNDVRSVRACAKIIRQKARQEAQSKRVEEGQIHDNYNKIMR